MFAYNAKALQYSFLFSFFLFFGLPWAVFERTGKRFFANISSFVTQNACDHDQICFLWLTGKYFVRDLFIVTSDACDLWCVMCFRKIRNGGIKWSCKYYPCCSWFILNFIYGGNKHSHCKHNLIYGNQRSHHPKKVKKARHFEARWKMTENPNGQKKFISNQLYNVLKILHRIYVYRKLFLHHWWPACSSRDTNSGFKFWIWFRMIWGRRRVTRVIQDHNKTC